MLHESTTLHMGLVAQSVRPACQADRWNMLVRPPNPPKMPPLAGAGAEDVSLVGVGAGANAVVSDDVAEAAEADGEP